MVIGRVLLASRMRPFFQMKSPILRYFDYAHLPESLQKVSKPIGDLAQQIDADVPDGPEKSAGLRKLLEAKDCLVRAALPPPAGGLQ